MSGESSDMEADRPDMEPDRPGPRGGRVGLRIVRIGAVVEMGLALSWIACAYVVARPVKYGSCCGAGDMFGSLGFDIAAGGILAFAATSLGAAVLAGKGGAYGRWLSVLVLALAVFWAARQVRTPWPGPDSVWSTGRTPGWFAVLMQGCPTLIGGGVALLLMLVPAVLRPAAPVRATA